MSYPDVTGGFPPASMKPTPVSRIAPLLGAGVSLALILGTVVWGYRLVVRDVSGIPVVRAMEGPVRVLPDNPGGVAADHQGLAVNAIAEARSGDLADRVILAPQPVDLADEDAPQGALGGTAEAVRAATSADGSVEALVRDLLTEAQPLAELDPAPESDVQDASTSVDPEVRITVSGLRPRQRPAELRPADLRVASAAPIAPVVASARQIDPDSLPVGTRLAQLGAFDSPETASREWDRLNGRFGDFMVGKAPVIQQAQSGGRTFWRLRAHGFADLSDARRFCAALVAEKAECIPVVTR